MKCYNIDYYVFHNFIIIIQSDLPSSSTIVTIALPGLPMLTLLGSEDELITSIKFLLPLNILSSLIGISNEILVSPAANVTLYGPEL